MPWYWSDDVARSLLEAGRIDANTAETLIRAPVALRRPENGLDEAARGLQEDGEVPLAA